MTTCEVCDAPIQPPDVTTDAPLVCAECYDPEAAFADELPTSESGTVPAMWVCPLEGP